jgi:hypothetical protein
MKFGLVASSPISACSALRAMTNQLRYCHAAVALNLINVSN